MFAGAMVNLGRQWRSGEGEVEVEVRVVVNRDGACAKA